MPTLRSSKKDTTKRKEEEPPKEKPQHAKKPKKVTSPKAKKEETSHPGHSQESSILENGHIYFFYRPKVDHTEAHSIEDVQRLYMVLSPLAKKDSDEKAVKRLIILVRKMLPETDEKTRSKHQNKMWAFVAKASENIDDIHSALDEEHHTTKTQGERTTPAARPVAEGFYAIVKHEKGHTHLAYVLELPDHLGPVQKAFHIHKEGSYIISVKNPERSKKGAGFKGLDKKAAFPSHLIDMFEGKSWSPINSTELLNYDNAEILLIGASDNLVTEFGKTGEKIEMKEQKDAKNVTQESLFKDLHMSKQEHPPQPFLQGVWK